jgi:hypothetical protein
MPSSCCEVDAVRDVTADPLARVQARALVRTRWRGGHVSPGCTWAPGRCTPRIAAVSPNAILNSIYVGLLEVIEGESLAVLPVAQRPLPEFLLERHRLHARLVDVIAVENPVAVLKLITRHNATAG